MKVSRGSVGAFLPLVEYSTPRFSNKLRKRDWCSGQSETHGSVCRFRSALNADIYVPADIYAHVPRLRCVLTYTDLQTEEGRDTQDTLPHT